MYKRQVYQEVKASLYESGCTVPSVPFIGGLGGEDLTIDMMAEAIDTVQGAAENMSTVWLKRE